MVTGIGEQESEMGSGNEIGYVVVWLYTLCQNCLSQIYLALHHVGLQISLVVIPVLGFLI